MLLLPVLAGLLASCATTIRTETVQRHDSAECVVLLHGLNRSWRTMQKMAESLQQAGLSDKAKVALYMKWVHGIVD